jgi:acyl dehydratase
MTRKITSIDEFESLVGEHLGYSDYLVVSQEMINLFADATGDHQWIHVDPERAASGPFGAPIAHGYLTLSLIPALIGQVFLFENLTFGVNYGCNKVRFAAPVPAGSELRLGVGVASVERIEGGAQVVLDASLEIKDATKPSCVAQVVYRYYS